MSRKVVQMIVGAMILLGWGFWGAYGIPTSRLEGLVNYPNPFDSRVTNTYIVYTLSNNSQVDIRLYDLFGVPVREWSLAPGAEGAQAGMNRVAWDGTNSSGEKVSAGGYICQVMASEDDGLVQGIRKIGVVR